MKIVLVGYMGCGKSTIGYLLAKKKYMPFIDLDVYIEEKEKATIQTIFKEKGEIYFRKIEHQYLKEILYMKKDIVLSLGGGTPCYANNMNEIEKSEAISVYLKATISTLKERLLKGKKNRPLIAKLEDENLSEFIAKHVFERSTFYNKATHKINIDGKTKSQLVAELRILLH